jgi:acetylornithine/succinyldiaminopimelate/putrescine aminotransferase
MILARFYPAQSDSPKAKYRGRVPVVLVIGDDDGGVGGNYHGTTILTQIMRGMWPRLAEGLEKSKLLLVRPVRPNKIEDVEAAVAKYEKPPYKIAGLFHEMILMNYGAVRLRKSYIKRAYALCRKHDIPTVADEIQSCLWSPELFMFREYGIKPTFLAIGKGFPGGEYSASRILFNGAMDSLPQFGALVTNGQEELASLAYLITMRWAEANADTTAAIGEYYEERLRDLARKRSKMIVRFEGRRHLAGLCFNDLQEAKAFGKQLVERGLDISVQTYKASCPPVALTKLPLTTGYEAVDWIVDQMDKTAEAIKQKRFSERAG